MKNIPAYSPDAVEKKWQKHWEDTHAFAAEKSHEKPKFYPLIEFPYPSGAGLHVGHPRSNTAMDIIARKRRMEGYNVLFPIGLRRLWPADGELRHQEQDPPRHRHGKEHRPFPRATEAHRLFLRLRPGDFHHRPQVLQVDAVDLSETL